MSLVSLALPLVHAAGIRFTQSNTSPSLICARLTCLVDSLVVANNEDGTSLYKVHLYLGIFLFAAPIVVFAGAAFMLRSLLSLVEGIMANISREEAALFFRSHPLRQAARDAAADSGPYFSKTKDTALLASVGSSVGCCSDHPQEFWDEVDTGRDSLLHLEETDFLDSFEMMRKDVVDAMKVVDSSLSNLTSLITQGLSALAVFLIVTGAMTIPTGQRVVVVLLLIFAVAWIYMLGTYTRSSRVYSVLVIAESSKYVNLVLHMDQCNPKYKDQDNQEEEDCVCGPAWCCTSFLKILMCLLTSIELFSRIFYKLCCEWCDKKESQMSSLCCASRKPKPLNWPLPHIKTDASTKPRTFTNPLLRSSVAREATVFDKAVQRAVAGAMDPIRHELYSLSQQVHHLGLGAQAGKGRDADHLQRPSLFREAAIGVMDPMRQELHSLSRQVHHLSLLTQVGRGRGADLSPRPNVLKEAVAGAVNPIITGAMEPIRQELHSLGQQVHQLGQTAQAEIGQAAQAEKERGMDHPSRADLLREAAEQKAVLDHYTKLAHEAAVQSLAQDQVNHLIVGRSPAPNRLYRASEWEVIAPY